MRQTLLGFVLLVGIWMGTTPARAGVYHSREMQTAMPTEPFGDRSVLSRRSDLIGSVDVGDPTQVIKGTLRADYLDQVALLEQKRAKEPLTSAERLDLSACYIRLGRYGKAREAVGKPDPKDPCYFLLQSNLAMANWNLGLLDQAFDLQREVLRAWPARYPGWTWTQWHEYLRSEEVLLRLMKSRRLLRDKPQEALDPLFEGVRFIGPSKEYEAGVIAPEMAEKLPGDAEALVIQLNLWMPTDPFLFWYYGELLNARGQVGEAYRIFDSLVDRSKMNVRELKNHRGVVREAKGQVTEPKKADNAADTAEPEPEKSTKAAKAEEVPWLPDWRTLGVGFLGGVLFAVVASLQWRQWRRPARIRS